MRISDWSSDVCSSDLVPEEIAEQSQAHDTDEAAPKPKRAPRARRAPKSEAVADESHTMDAAILPPSISRADNDSGEEERPTPRKRTRRTRPEIGRAHVCTPVTNAQLVCRLLLAAKMTKQTTKRKTTKDNQ